MAYGAWQPTSGTYYSQRVWTRISDYNGTSTVYTIDVNWRYQQDLDNNMTQIELAQVVLNQHLSGWGMSGATFHGRLQWNDNASDEKTAVISGNPPNSFTLNCFKYVFNIKHNNDGTFPTQTFQWMGWVTGTTDGHRPTMSSWQNATFSPNIPKIPQTAGTASISLNSKTHKTITLNCSSTYGTTKAQYRIGGGSWVPVTPPAGLSATNGGTGTFQISGLSPNTTYKIEWQYQRSTNSLWSNIASVTVTTDKPPAPTTGSISSITCTHNSITMSYSGGSFGDGATWGYYEVTIGQPGLPATSSNNGKNTTKTWNELSPDTQYFVYVQLVDNYGTYGNLVNSSVTTYKIPLVISGIVTGNITNSSVTVAISLTTNGNTINKIEFRQNNGSWESVGTNVYNKTFTELSPNTAYTFEIRVTDSYGRTYTKSVSATTLPNPPTLSVSTSNITHNSAKITATATISSPGSIAKYELLNGSTPVSSNTTGAFSLTELTPNTVYTYTVKVTDNYGRIVSKGISFTTLPALPTISVASSTVDDNYCTVKLKYTIGTGAVLKSLYYTVTGSSSQFSIPDANNVKVDISHIDDEQSFTVKFTVTDSYGRSASTSLTKQAPSRSFIYVVTASGATRCESYLIESDGSLTKLSKSSNTSLIG